jgi:antirestriction protein
MKELNLDNPVFTFYVSVAGMSHQSATQHLAEFKNMLSYDNITTWVIPVQGESKVECVYPGKSMYNTPELENLIKEINDLFSDSDSYEDFKINIRDWRIGKIFNESNK